MYDNTIKVSIIIVNYNGMSYIEACLRSVIDQDYPYFEVVLVDNCSTDGSVEYVKQHFSDVQVVENNKNLGYAGGINSGIALAKGMYFAVLNVDTEVERNWLRYLIEFMDENPDVGALTSKSLLYKNRDRVGVQGLNIHITGLAFVRDLNKRDDKVLIAPFEVAAVSGCSFVIRREIVGRMGGLNEDNFMYYDDVDLSWLIRLMGYRIFCVPQSVVYHEYELGMSTRKIFWLEYGRWASLLCYLGLSTFIVLTPALALTELLVVVYCIIRGPQYIKAKIRAVGSIMRNCRRIAQRRRQVQKLRKVSDLQILKKFKINYEWGQLSNILERRDRTTINRK